MFVCSGRSQGGDHITDFILSQRHHIHITLYYQQALKPPTGFTRLKQTVEFLPLVKYCRFRRVEIFGAILLA